MLDLRIGDSGERRSGQRADRALKKHHICRSKRLYWGKLTGPRSYVFSLLLNCAFLFTMHDGACSAFFLNDPFKDQLAEDWIKSCASINQLWYHVRIESLQIIERERRISLEKGRGRREKREGNWNLKLYCIEFCFAYLCCVCTSLFIHYTILEYSSIL